VPFMVSSRGYALVWDNPSKTTVVLGFKGRNTWSSEVGDHYRRGNERRDLRGLPSADGPHAHAAEGGVRIHDTVATLIGLTALKQLVQQFDDACVATGRLKQ
jgi:hypothetical protein